MALRLDGALKGRKGDGIKAGVEFGIFAGLK